MINEAIVTYERQDRIGIVTLNRPDKRNALNPELVERLTDCLKQAGEDENTKVIILKANGPVFSAGADLAYMRQLREFSKEENIADSTKLKNLFSTILLLPKLVIAQVEGHAIAGGCGLATACDFVFAVPEAQFGYTEVKLGFVPALVSCLLIRKTGETTAKRLLYTAELFSAEEALKLQLIHFVTNSNEISQTVRDFALQLCETASSNSLRLTKQLINQTTYKELDQCLNEAVQINAEARAHEDFKKGIDAFLEKKKINW